MLPRDENSDCLEEKVSYEIRESPSMMWKRSIVQAKAGHMSAPATLTFALFVVIALWSARGDAADLVIEIPGWGAAGAEGAHYRLDYRPPQGSPAPNYTVPARASTINFQGLPGTKYHFMLYYSNATFADLLTWNQTIITAPEPPTNLTVTLGRNKQAAISWAPPAHGDYSGFRFKVLPLSERAEGGARNISVEGAGNWSHVLRDLSPGATYQLHAFTLLHDKESAAYTSFNFTTKPNTPGKFIVWFRNETTLLVLWQPPYPPGAYTHYKVSIEPKDARESELYVEKEGEPPGPAQAAFKGLVPGRAYDISVQTVSDDQLSAPTTAQYRTVPLRPRNVSVPARSLAETAFRVTWLPPAELSEFEKYQVSVSAGAGAAGRRLPPQLRAREEPPACAFDGLEPGAHYTVTVKTMSDVAEIANMTHGERYEIQLDTASEDAAGETVDSGQPLSAEHTVRPNPVSNVAQLADTRNVTLEWPRPAGRVEWYEVRWWASEQAGGAAGAAGAAGGARNVSAEGGARTVRALLGELAPGRGYSVSIAAHSHELASDIFTMHTRTRPLIQSEMTIVNESGDGDDNDTLPAILVLYTPTPSSASKFDAYRFRLEGGAAPARWQERPATPPDAADDAAGQQQVAFRSLTPGRLYNLTMWTVSHNVTSHPVQRQARLYPRPITELNATAVGAREISLAWARPAGDFTDFEVQYLVDEDRLETRTTDRLALTLTELRPYTLYVFTVVVQAGTPATILTRSRARSGSFRTLEAPPAAPSRFQLIDATPTELAFEWALPARDAHGVLSRFRIYVAPAGAGGEAGAARWVDFGPEARAGRVAGLAAGGDYELWLRAANGAGEGAAARVRQRMAIAAPPRPTALPAEVRRSSTTVAVSFGADYFSPANGNVTAYTLVLAEEPRADTPARLPSWRDVHRLPVWPPYQVTEPYYPFHSSAVEEFTIGSERCEGGGRSYCNGPLKPGSRYYVKLRAFTAPDKFTDTAADLPCNRPKNRFTNILPYDHSRYKLQPVDDEEGSDYINANYVPGHNSPREFIVTQGPLHCTRDDFWRMCWESGSRSIVMLTRCVEKGREKCDRYWPYDTRPVYYGDIAVTALNESRYPDWTVTELAVCRGAEQRVLRHFHFTTWPDFGVPDPPTALARFVRAFRERCPPDTRPVIVHCSAGVGRSGTFITLDRALQQLDAHAECLDIFGMVHAMRRERVWMVQTEQQYICIHQCVVAALEGADLAPPPPNNHHHNAAFEGKSPARPPPSPCRPSRPTNVSRLSRQVAASDTTRTVVTLKRKSELACRLV
ncbi:tyrosine-protein phosphatase 10D-like isoform X6 [Vanessa atalanta]|uniref:tyrosine-protein phosphatase 10D-like isoform X6 n=1 Tax=Vanessa atalanta TaxID=42275 RepID=UPI001FCD1A66|nr:tyrosine-protein phosphatase 10D-like isoform X6 [Vanessa atalanta]